MVSGVRCFLKHIHMDRFSNGRSANQGKGNWPVSFWFLERLQQAAVKADAELYTSCINSCRKGRTSRGNELGEKGFLRDWRTSIRVCTHTSLRVRHTCATLNNFCMHNWAPKIAYHGSRGFWSLRGLGTATVTNRNNWSVFCPENSPILVQRKGSTRWLWLLVEVIT